MKVSELYWPSVVWVPVGQPLMKAACKMREFDTSCIIVMDDGELAGVVTDHDLMRAAIDGVDLRDASVEDYMTPRPATIDLSADVADAASKMIAAHARHLPVVEHGALVGMVSARDVLIAATDSV